MEQSCWICKREEHEDKRREWGCHEPTAEPWDIIPCWVCRSQPAEARQYCPLCKGEEVVLLHDCPWRMVGPREQFVCEAVANCEGGVLPFGSVGWADLPATLHDAMALVSEERALIRERDLPKPPP